MKIKLSKIWVLRVFCDKNLHDNTLVGTQENYYNNIHYWFMIYNNQHDIAMLTVVL